MKIEFNNNEVVWLSEDDFKLISNALNYVFNRKLDLIKQSSKILSDEERQVIIEKANPYMDLDDKLKEGKYKIKNRK